MLYDDHVHGNDDVANDGVPLLNRISIPNMTTHIHMQNSTHMSQLDNLTSKCCMYISTGSLNF